MRSSMKERSSRPSAGAAGGEVAAAGLPQAATTRKRAVRIRMPLRQASNVPSGTACWFSGRITRGRCARALPPLLRGRVLDQALPRRGRARRRGRRHRIGAPVTMGWRARRHAGRPLHRPLQPRIRHTATREAAAKADARAPSGRRFARAAGRRQINADAECERSQAARRWEPSTARLVHTPRSRGPEREPAADGGDFKCWSLRPNQLANWSW